MSGKSLQLTLRIYALTKQFPKDEQIGLSLKYTMFPITFQQTLPKVVAGNRTKNLNDTWPLHLALLLN